LSKGIADSEVKISTRKRIGYPEELVIRLSSGWTAAKSGEADCRSDFFHVFIFIDNQTAAYIFLIFNGMIGMRRVASVNDDVIEEWPNITIPELVFPYSKINIPANVCL
jgi:hypothetical protein